MLSQDTRSRRRFSLKSPIFTVFTATHNRAHTLGRVYESLCAQTMRDFEWVIVDDGSTDDTEGLVAGWQVQAPFRIIYSKQPKRGKHVAFNRGVRLGQGELFLNLDSDDACVPEALERLLHHWCAIPEHLRGEFSAVTALCKDQHGKPVGGQFPQAVIDSDSLEMKYRWRVAGEKWGFHRREVLSQFPFPEIEGVNFVPEGVVWGRIARRYKTRYVNEYLRIYWQGDVNQLMSPGVSSSLARSHSFWHREVLNSELDWFLSCPPEFLRSAAHLSRFSFHACEGVRAQFSQLRSFARILWLAALPVGVFAYLRDKVRQGIVTGKDRN